MLYRAYELHDPLLSAGETLVTPTVKMQQRSEQLQRRFEKLAALEDAFYAKAELPPRKLKFVERLFAAHAGSKATSIEQTDWTMCQRAWRANALRSIVTAKLFGLHVAAADESVPQDATVQLAREPRLMGVFVETITGRIPDPRGFRGRVPLYGMQCTDLAMTAMLRDTPALARYGKVEVEYTGEPAPRALPQLPKAAKP